MSPWLGRATLPPGRGLAGECWFRHCGSPAALFSLSAVGTATMGIRAVDPARRLRSGFGSMTPVVVPLCPEACGSGVGCFTSLMSARSRWRLVLGHARRVFFMSRSLRFGLCASVFGSIHSSLSGRDCIERVLQRPIHGLLSHAVSDPIPPWPRAVRFTTKHTAVGPRDGLV